MANSRIRAALQAFTKLDVIIKELEKEIKLKNFDIIEYVDRNGSSIFGEKEAITYCCQFSTYNIVYEIKFMTFEYQSKTELLKLHIQYNTTHIEKEIKTCQNFLQRKRNLQHTFTTLIAFSRSYESRRIICNFLLRKSRNFKVYTNKDGGKIVAYSDPSKQAKVGIFWTIEWTPERRVFDKIWFFYELSTMPNEEELKEILQDLTEPYLEFDKKVDLWHNFVRKISNSDIVLDVSKHGDDGLRSLTGINQESDEEIDGDEFYTRLTKDEPSSTVDQNGRADSPDGSPAAKTQKKDEDDD